MENVFSLIVPKTARIFSIGKQGSAEALIVLHGYGQLSQYFIRHFAFLPTLFDRVCVYAPEGLSRFYKEGFYGQVGASWMTKEDRESEICDQYVYLDLLVNHILAQNPSTRIHVLGFSQGVATLWRWIANGQVKPASCVLWAGEIPEEFTQILDEKLSATPFYFIIGNEDEFISPTAALKQLEKLKSRFPKVRALSYNGTHTLDKDTLKVIYKEILV